jgi:hypothetical protein
MRTDIGLARVEIYQLIALMVVIDQFLGTHRFCASSCEPTPCFAGTLLALDRLVRLNQMSVAFCCHHVFHAVAGVIAFIAAAQYSASLSLVVANRRVICRA